MFGVTVIDDLAELVEKLTDRTQIESLTVSWMTRESLAEVIQGLLSGAYEELEFRPHHPLRTEPASEHSCALCR
jgi:hypothetical protein